ncbi:hypothetical protein Pmani_032563 [Petrolisthes manimaculis]|uniref:Uncharacterized protein n=1 Tax=Petrolisthes manimaculis TaxID=1843537 RepID=A0AAE1NSX7_9EUCA|nr:hypothetical protein Pmani_032563 [Petrolisthes manimaculis]
MSPRLAPQLMRPSAARALPHHRLPSPLPPSNSATTPSTVVPTVLETVLYASLHAASSDFGPPPNVWQAALAIVCFPLRL